MVDRITVSGTGSNVGSESAWETIKFVEIANDFLIQCGSHYAVVRVSGAKVFIHADTSHDETTYEKDWGGFLTQSENEKRERVLENVGISPKFYIEIYDADVKFEEGVLEPDEQVAVLGLGNWVNTSEHQELVFLAKIGVESVFEIRDFAEQKLFISDTSDVLVKLRGSFSQRL